MGTVFLQGYAAADVYLQRISSDQVEEELNRLQQALNKSREQIEKLKSKHGATLGSNEIRIFDSHMGYLSDPKFIDEVETMVMEERYTVRSCINRVVDNYDRIFQLVESDHIRKRAGDLREVATRVLRNLDDGQDDSEPTRPSGSPHRTRSPSATSIESVRKLT